MVLRIVELGSHMHKKDYFTFSLPAVRQRLFLESLGDQYILMNRTHGSHLLM